MAVEIGKASSFYGRECVFSWKDSIDATEVGFSSLCVSEWHESLAPNCKRRGQERGCDPTLGYAYVFGLSIVQLGCGFLTIGLIRPWGERLFGRRVPLWPVVVLAALGGLAVTWLFSISLPLALAQGRRPDNGLVQGWPFALMFACYLPIFLWGPLELASVVGYARRRLADRRPVPDTRSR